MSTLSSLYPNLAGIITITNTPKEGDVYNPVSIEPMLKAKSIDDLIPAYNSVLKKLLIFNYLKEEEIPERWFVNNTPAQTELRTLLNDLIVKIFNSTEYSYAFAAKCFVNLRRAPNFRNSITQILSKSLPEVSRNHGWFLKNMRTVYDAYESSVSLSTNDDYSDFRKSLNYLLEIGFIKSLKEEAFLKQINASENRGALKDSFSNVFDSKWINANNLYSILGYIVLTLAMLLVLYAIAPVIQLLTIPIVFFFIGVLLFAL